MAAVAPAAAPPPVVILSAPRSFSSVVAAMLGQHPQMYGLAETHLFGADYVRHLSEFQFRDYPHGLMRVLAQLKFGSQTSFNVIRAKSWLLGQAGQRTGWMFNHILELAAPARCVEKSISTCEAPENLERLLNCVPEAHFIHLTRHPLPMGESALELVARFLPVSKKHQAFLYDYSTQPPTADPQFYWLKLNRNIEAALAKVPDRRRCVVRGEDLLSHPDRELTRLCQWLGVRDDAAAVEAMKHPENSPFARPGPPNATFGGDPKFMDSPALRAFKSKGWNLGQALPWRSDKGFQPEVRAMAERLGYS